MKLSEDVKQKINEEFEEFMKWCNERFSNGQYGNMSDEKRDELGAFYTPPELCIKMIEKFDNLDDDILDPTAGSGSLLAACIIAGADPKRVYANELDADICNDVLKPRLMKKQLGVPEMNIHVGDALNEDCLKLWSDEYEFKNGQVRIAGKMPGKLGSSYYGIDKSKVKILK